MLNKIKDTIKKYNLIEPTDKIVIGVSGGPDSICLLNVLYEFGYDIVVAHINHGLRENAILDEQYVKDYCNKRSIPIFIKKLDLNGKDMINGKSTEEAGRFYRYKFFNEVFEKENCTKIATAHNLNDKVETVFLNLFRGTGISGLKGIEIKRNNIIRPLLDISREEIEFYCTEKNLNPRIDESNLDTDYTRNKIRNDIIPYIEAKINSNIVNTIYRLSKIVEEEEDYSTRQLEIAYNSIYKNSISNTNIENAGIYSSLELDLKKFNNLDIYIKKKIILKSIYNILGNTTDIQKIHIDDIITMCEKNVGNKYLTPNKNIKISVNKGIISFEYINLNSEN